MKKTKIVVEISGISETKTKTKTRTKKRTLITMTKSMKKTKIGGVRHPWTTTIKIAIPRGTSTLDEDKDGEEKEIDTDFLSGALMVRDISYISMMEHELIHTQLSKKFELVVHMTRSFAYLLGNSREAANFGDRMDNRYRWEGKKGLAIRFWEITPY